MLLLTVRDVVDSSTRATPAEKRRAFFSSSTTRELKINMLIMALARSNSVCMRAAMRAQSVGMQDTVSDVRNLPGNLPGAAAPGIEFL